MRALQTFARIVLGGIFLVFGADYVLHFMPELPFTDAGARYLEALLETGYMFPLIKSVEVIGGLLILSGRFVPLGILLVAPVIVNIALYHAVLDPNGSWIALTLVACEAFLAWTYRSAYRPLFSAVRPPARVEAREGVIHAVATRL